MRTIHCAKCNVLVAEIESGSKIRKGAIMLCGVCEDNRKTLQTCRDLKGGKTNLFGDLFGRSFK